MKQNREIKCPECGKIIGEYVLQFTMSSPLGGIPFYDSKIDYRKGAHIGFGKGNLCKKCAKRIFPDGVAYKVLIWYVKIWMTPSCGINHSGLFASKAEAEEAVKDMNRRRFDNHARIEEAKF